MRYVRLQLIGKRDYMKKVVINFLIIFAISIASAFLIEQKCLFTSETVKKHDDINLEINQKMTFYIVQVGYFNEKKNADNLVKILNTKNIMATTINIDGKYRVITWIDYIKEDIKIYENYLINLNLSYIIKNVELSINNKEYVELIKTVIKQIRLLKGSLQQEQLSIDNTLYIKDDQIKKFYEEYILFMKNYKMGDIGSCLNNLANEIFILRNIH